MSSRKRQSDTTVIKSSGTSNDSVGPSSRLRVRVKRFHGVARWTWNAGSEDEVCGICQSAFEGVAPGIKYPGDECPVVFGKCGHGELRVVDFIMSKERQIDSQRIISFFSISFTMCCHLAQFISTNLPHL